jgi:hypothetical protein
MLTAPPDSPLESAANSCFITLASADSSSARFLETFPANLALLHADTAITGVSNGEVRKDLRKRRKRTF